MECFRIDESGYTGFDLFNEDQRFQGATAIAITNEEANRLIKEYFPRLQAPELKYRTLSRRVSNHERMLGLQRDLLRNYKCVTYVCDKRYLLLLFFLDYAVEPFYYERGFDFYKNGQNYAMASLLSVIGPTLLGKEAFYKLLASFQHAVKEKTPSALKTLVVAAKATNWWEFPEAMGPLAQYEAPECLAAIATPGVDTDAALVVLQSLISRMEVMSDGPYRVEHDQSNNLLKYHDLLQRFIDHDKKVEFYQTEIANVQFPLKLSEVVQVDSRTSPAVQLADVMTGSAIDAANTLAGIRSSCGDPEAIMSLYSENQFIHMTPSIDFEEQRRFREGGETAKLIDYFSKHFYSPP